MKINGVTFKTENVETIVIPRSDGNDIIFKAAPVVNHKEYNEQYPEPKPPMVMRKGEMVSSPDLEDREYKEKFAKWLGNRWLWMFVKSLQATPGVSWDKVDIKEPTTWGLLEEELGEAGFTPPEINMIFAGVLKANSLDQKHIEKARDRFFKSLLPVKAATS